MHVLENPVWHAQNGPQRTVAEVRPRASRFLPDVAVFGALPDDIGPDAWDELRALVGPGGLAVLVRSDLAVPDTWLTQFAMPCRQMWLTRALTMPAHSRLRSTVSGLDAITALHAADVPEMLDLVQRTRPGPFAPRTIELGTYLGVRGERKDLVAMAGERFHPPGYTEISAVCTDDAHRGQGLASRLVQALVRGIHERGETPILHLTQENEAAHRLYDELGFETRRLIDVVGVRAPG
jgi:GNAT superfamily N-acetyltransferase